MRTSLTTTFILQQSDSNSRNVMYGFLAANGDAGTGKDGERSPDYGKLRLLELPRSSVVPGRVRLRTFLTLMLRCRTS